MRYLLLVVTYFVVYLAGATWLGGHGVAASIFDNLALVVPPAAICLIILRRRRRWFGCQRLFWDTFAIGVSFWIVGHLGWAFGEIVRGQASWLQWHTVFSLCGGIFPLIALSARPHLGVRTRAVSTATLVIANCALLSFFIYAYFALIPSFVLGPRAAEVPLLALVQVNRALLFGGFFLAFWFARRTPWRRTFGILALGAGIGFVLRIVTSLAILRGAYQTGPLYDLAWIVPFVCYAWAALSAPDSFVEAPSAADVATQGRFAVVAAVVIFLIPLIGYITPSFQPIGELAEAFRTLLTGLMTVAGLGLLTLWLAIQHGQLQRADARIKLLAAANQQTGDLILISRAQGTFEDANDVFLQATGYTKDELSRMSLTALVEEGIEEDTARMKAELAARGVWRGTRHRRKRDGSTLPVFSTVVGLRDEAGGLTHFVTVERDITDELRLRDQLVHSERLSAVGELVAGVAHEINNPLQTIVGSVELMLQEYPDSPHRQDLEMVRQEAGRAGHIVRNLLSFVRRRAPDRMVVDLNKIVRATLELHDYHLRQQNITVTIDLSPGSASVVANREEIQQIVLNLIFNAEHAIGEESPGGTISIRTWTTGGHHVLEVADTGPGVSAEHKGRVFEPFFTTKEVGEGTGLGLSIAHGIALAHGGSLELVTSAVGACFRLTLPAHAPGVDAARRLSRTGREGVALIVDDEAPIRALVARLLSARGLEVVEAETAEAALSIADQRDVRLVICDVRMPGIGGVGLLRRLSEREPDLARRFVFITGDGSADELDGCGEIPVLEKPFTVADLREVLAKVDPEVPA